MTTNANWTLLTNHGACLLLLATGRGATIRDIAEAMRVTERSAARILADLRSDRYIVVERDGRRNHYSVNLDAPLRHPIGRGQRVADLFARVVERAQGRGVERAANRVGAGSGLAVRRGPARQGRPAPPR